MPTWSPRVCRNRSTGPCTGKRRRPSTCWRPRTFSDEIGDEVEFRIGIHSGPVVAGVIGHRKLFNDVWGDPINTGHRTTVRRCRFLAICDVQNGKSASGTLYKTVESGQPPQPISSWHLRAYSSALTVPVRSISITV